MTRDMAALYSFNYDVTRMHVFTRTADRIW